MSTLRTYLNVCSLLLQMKTKKSESHGHVETRHPDPSDDYHLSMFSCRAQAENNHNRHCRKPYLLPKQSRHKHQWTGGYSWWEANKSLHTASQKYSTYLKASGAKQIRYRGGKSLFNGPLMMFLYLLMDLCESACVGVWARHRSRENTEHIIAPLYLEPYF